MKKETLKCPVYSHTWEVEVCDDEFGGVAFTNMNDIYCLEGCTDKDFNQVIGEMQ